MIALRGSKPIVTVSPEVQPGPHFVLVPELENAW